MTAYMRLVLAEREHCHTIEIREKATGKTGVASTCASGVDIWYGADDGGDDKTVTPEEFSRDFEITAILGSRDKNEFVKPRVSISLPRACFAEEDLTKLQKLVNSKAALFMKALGTHDLPIVVTEDQITFPWFPESSADDLQAYTQLVDKLGCAARSARRVNTTNHPIESEKYAMRCFLIRLGLGGAEYKNARSVLTRNLSGSSAFKSAADAEAFAERQRTKRNAGGRE